jgi:anti-anti-sigma factor
MIVLQPQGRLDLQGGGVLLEQLAGLGPQPHDLWVLDLAQIDFLDSSGLAALVTGLKAALVSGSRLVLCNLQAPVRIIFELTQLDSVFEIYESYEAFLTSLEPQSNLSATKLQLLSNLVVVHT